MIRKSSGLRTLESALYRGGLGPVAGVDEVGPRRVRRAARGRGVRARARTGWRASRRSTTPRSSTRSERERLFPLIRRYALAYHVVFIPSVEVDRRGVHVANIEGMRRAVAGLVAAARVTCLSDGFRVPGLPMPSLPVVGGDAAAACIAAASVLAKVSRDRLMVDDGGRASGLRLRRAQGVQHARHTARRWPSWGRAASTGTRSSTCARLVQRWTGDGARCGPERRTATWNPSSRARSGRGGWTR